MDVSPRVVETHVSVLFFTADRVYKLKKPVTLDFIDLSSIEARRNACEREVELNRRLAPDVYLGVADVTGPEGVCDHLVVMRRLPDERRLSQLLGEGSDVGECLDRVANAVATMHGSYLHNPVVDRAADIDTVRHNWRTNLRELGQFFDRLVEPDTAARIENLAFRYLEGRQNLFEQRVAKGHAVDGHGDLLAEDIFCMPDGPRILDCLEFDDKLRFGDSLSDAAFLAMDLEHLGHAGAAQRFIASYTEFSGDVYPQSLLDHYIAYRGLVRAKVTCIRSVQEGDGRREEVRALLELSLRHLEDSETTLVLVGGLPGAGKSTLARGLAEERGWTVLRSDVVRKELAGVAPSGSGSYRFGEGIYSEDMTELTYRELLRRAEGALGVGESVILDASWVDDRWRTAARDLADRTSCRLVEMCCTVGTHLAAERLNRRRERMTDPSDATQAVLEEMSELARPWPTASLIDTSGTVAATLRQGMRVLESR